MSKSSGTITASGCYKCDEGELSEVEVAAARRNFQAYDIDQDGIISREDFHQAMSKYKEQLGERTPEQLDEMYASVDIHGTGKVDFMTFAEMRVRKKNHTNGAPPASSGSVATPPATKSNPGVKTWQSAPGATKPPQQGGFFTRKIGEMLGICGCHERA